jgi:hypothetical protein
MPNGAACCLLQVCCDGPQRRKRSINWLVEKTGVSEDQVAKVFDALDAEVDFAPKGTQAMIDAVADMARKHTKE